MPNSGGNKSLFWLVAVSVVLIDLTSKLAAVAHLSPIPQPVIGQFVQLQLVYNPGAAFGVYLGEPSRWVFALLAVMALFILGAMVRRSQPDQKVRLVALALVCGGALGNLVDRVRSPRGVVDFIDIGVDFYRWPTFNFADLSVTTGAVLLVTVLWQEGRQLGRERRTDAARASPPA